MTSKIAYLMVENFYDVFIKFILTIFFQRIKGKKLLTRINSCEQRNDNLLKISMEPRYTLYNLQVIIFTFFNTLHIASLEFLQQLCDYHILTILGALLNIL